MPTKPSTLQPLLLLAEDDHNSAFLFEHTFKKVCPNWRFVCLPNGAEAVKFMEEKEKPHILVTDLNMPQMNGYEVLEWLRGRREKFPMIVVVTSGLFDAEIQKKCRQLGADELLPKGAANESIREMLRRFADLAEKQLGPGGS